ncbi:MAG: LruC domain-containing protein [Bacteroidales bacterium]|nr:LruC domain-containing protein [Bacteroidales bacterium]
MEIKNFIKLIIPIFLILITNSCQKKVYFDDVDSEIDKLVIAQDFDYKTTKNISVNITAVNFYNDPIIGAVIEIYDQEYFNEETNLLNENATLLFKGITNNNGVFSASFSIPDNIENIYVCPQYVGLPSQIKLPAINNEINCTIGNKSSGKSGFFYSESSDYQFMGAWNSLGVPDYLEPQNDTISSEFLADINASLPERVPLTQSHPEYLAVGSECNTKLYEDADVRITFVHEGAGWKNVLAYYTYEIGNAPQSVEDIEYLTVVFPNISYPTAGGLVSGNKIHLGSFPENTEIGWCLIAQGWCNSDVTDGIYKVYSNPELNPENDPELQQHNVLLYDDSRDIMLLGFEDIKRSYSSCDNDFNDAVFYVTVDPISAIEPQQYNKTASYEDNDGDGVLDEYDDYPDNPDLAFNNYYNGTLVFEDLWPISGDYDFNDLVLEYNINQITDNNNDVAKIEFSLIVQAVGANYFNGFGFELPVSYTSIESVTGSNLGVGYTSMNSNGTEQGQTNAVIIAFENASDILSSSGMLVNVLEDSEYIIPDTLFITVNLIAPVPTNELGTPPYNPFLISNGQRGNEIHLPDYEPTDLANTSLFGTGDDFTLENEGIYYKTSNYLPWALNINGTFNWTYENKNIISAYLKFANWAESSGDLYQNWYENISSYRDDSKIYYP